ncbi:MAG: DUF5659 domain-containing protein [Candidatus Gracilibacteria bacterium]|jgi:hypothetical protein
MKDANERKFTTKDFYITAFLLAKGFSLSHIDRANPQQVYFAFDYIEGRDKLVEDFLFSRALVEPKSFISAIKELKQLLHSND